MSRSDDQVPEEDQIWAKNGYAFVVHRVSDGMVYGAKYGKIAGKPLPPECDFPEYPHAIALRRCTIEQWLREIEGAVRLA